MHTIASFLLLYCTVLTASGMSSTWPQEWCDSVHRADYFEIDNADRRIAPLLAAGTRIARETSTGSLSAAGIAKMDDAPTQMGSMRVGLAVWLRIVETMAEVGRRMEHG